MATQKKKEPIVSVVIEEAPNLEVTKPPNPEVLEKPKRRRFSAKYKVGIVEQANACRDSREIGSLLRREGLYWSHLSKWRKAYESGALQGLSRTRGRKKKPKDPRDKELEDLRRDKVRLERRLTQAEKIIEVQKKVSELLGLTLSLETSESSDS